MPELNESDKEFIRTYVAETEDAQEQKRRRKECAEEYKVSLPTVSALTAWTTIRKKTKLVSPVEIKHEENAEGCHVNYDNPTKQLWREKWKGFLAKHTTLAERENMTVLCLPGKKCLELPVYLSLGFKPKNITGVEGGDEAAKNEFHTNAYRFGINARLGRLESILEHDTSVYDVVSLDFTGPLSKTCLDIVKMLPIAPKGDAQINKKSYFMINLLGKRESNENQSCLDFYASFTRPELMKMFEGGMDYDKFKEIFGYVSDLSDRAVSGEKVYSEADLKDKRNIGLAFMLSGLIAKDRRIKDSRWSAYRLEEIPFSARKNIDFNHYGSMTVTGLIHALSGHISQRMVDFFTIGTPQMLEIVGNYKPFVYDIEQYQYVSPVNNASSPFLTEMYQLMTPMADYAKARHFVRFIIDTIFWQAINEDKKIYVEIRNKHSRHIRPGSPLDGKDSIGFVDEIGHVISSVVWHRVIEAYELLMSHIHKDKVMPIIASGQNNRINLSE